MRANIVSELDHPIMLAYAGEAVSLPPRGRVEVEDARLLGALPRGVVVFLLDNDGKESRKITSRK